MQDTQANTKSDLVESADETVLKRAQWEAFEFEIEASGLVKIINGSHEDPEEHTYRVKVEDGLPVACECPHFRFNDDVGLCKHSASLLLREPVLKAAMSQQQAADRAMMADGGSTCPESHPNCEGLQSPRPRPELCYDCWGEWASQ